MTRTTFHFPVPVALVVATSLCAPACTAELGGDGNGGKSDVTPAGTANGEGPLEGGDGDTLEGYDSAAHPGSPRLWRLTKAQFQNTTFDLLGVELTAALPDDPTGAEYSNAADKQSLLPPVIAAYFDAASQLAEDAVSNRAEELLPCSPASTANAACVRDFVEQWGRLAYRRSLQPTEVDELMALYAEVSEQSTSEQGAMAVITGMLLSPKFLFRWEIGEDLSGDGVRQLSALETATALAFTMTERGPDAALLELAEAGSLSTPEQRADWVRSQLSEEEAREVVNHFISEWLHLDRLPDEARSLSLFPEATPELFQSLLEEWDLLLESTVWAPSGGLEDLLTTTQTHVDARTASLYEVPTPASGQMTLSALDPMRRHGVLTTAPFLNSHAGFERTIPVEMGHFIRHRVLCDEVPPPPPNLDVGTLPDIVGATQRERLAAHTEEPSCFACHQFMDDIGLAFENYDALGRFRLLDQGAPIDPAGVLVPMESGEEPIAFENGVDLAQIISASQKTYDCFATQAFRYVFGRHEHASDTEALNAISSSFQASNYSVTELLAAIVASEAFVTRSAP